MLFLGLLLVGTVLASSADALKIVRAPGWRQRMRLGLTFGLLIVGTDHLVTPERYVPMIESFLPYPTAWVLFTGLCEIAGGLGLCIPGLRRLSGGLLAVYFACVFPANVSNALLGLDVDGLPSDRWYYWLRLALQPIFIWWALVAGDVVHRGIGAEHAAPHDGGLRQIKAQSDDV